MGFPQKHMYGDYCCCSFHSSYAYVQFIIIWKNYWPKYQISMHNNENSIILLWNFNKSIRLTLHIADADIDLPVACK